MISKHQKFVLAAVTQNGLSLSYIEDDLQTPEICLAAVTQNGLSLQYVRDDLQTTEMCLAAVTQMYHLSSM